MRANVGDWLMIRSGLVGGADELGYIVEVRGADGSPPYLVRWLRDDHEGLVFPGADAVVLSASEKASLDERQRRRIADTRRAMRHHGRRSASTS